MPQNDRLRWLDAARGFAALTVLAAHTSGFFWSGYTKYIEVGNTGVVLFFIISGYIIPVSLERTTIPRFWLRRLFRLYPLYWVSMLLTLLVGSSPVTAPADVLANLTMLQPYLGIAHVSDVYWSLTVELTFYGFLTILAILKLHRATIPVILVLAGFLLTLAYLNVRWVLDLNIIYLPICLGGTLWYRYDAGDINRRTLLCCILIIALYILALPIPSKWSIGWLFALGVFALFHARREAPWPRFLVWCGVVSYSLYLLHPLALLWLGAWGIPLVFFIAGVSYRLIERPMIQVARSLEHMLFTPVMQLPSPLSIASTQPEPMPPAI